VRHALPFVVQLWLLVTPVAYPSRLLSDDWRMLYALNPMVGVVEGFRWALLDLPARPDLAMGLAALMSLVIFVAGARYFRSVERTFTDVI
jgi:lipopolysaccharide transport system permease protein